MFDPLISCDDQSHLFLCWRGGAAVWYADDGDLEGGRHVLVVLDRHQRPQGWSGLFTSSLIRPAPWFLLSVRSSMVAARGSVRLGYLQYNSTLSSQHKAQLRLVPGGNCTAGAADRRSLEKHSKWSRSAVKRSAGRTSCF